MNTIGHILRLTTFGESHGPAVGGVLDGFPPGIRIDRDLIDSAMRRRRPGQSALTTSRCESDRIEILSGLTPDDISLGSPIAFMCRNTDCRTNDYNHMAESFRPGHADYTYKVKYGLRDWRGGGRASARETLARVAAGAFATHILRQAGINISAALTGVGEVTAPDPFSEAIAGDMNPKLLVPEQISEAMNARILKARADGDSVGGSVGVIITGMPAALGQPVYAKLQADLAAAMLGINAAKGFEYGLGMQAAKRSGSETADSFLPAGNPLKSLQRPDIPGPAPMLRTSTNCDGGIQGGITNGMPVFFSVAFKPTPTISSPLPTADTSGKAMTLQSEGRHDPCVAVRAVPVVEAMTALIIADHLLLNRIISHESLL